MGPSRRGTKRKAGALRVAGALKTGGRAKPRAKAGGIKASSVLSGASGALAISSALDGPGALLTAPLAGVAGGAATILNLFGWGLKHGKGKKKHAHKGGFLVLPVPHNPAMARAGALAAAGRLKKRKARKKK